MFFNLLFSCKIIVGETAVFCLQLATRDFENQEKTLLTGDCCYINPLVRRTVRFLGTCSLNCLWWCWRRVHAEGSLSSVRHFNRMQILGHSFLELSQSSSKNKRGIIISPMDVKFHFS